MRYVKCSLCKEKKGCRNVYYKRRIKEAGDLQTLNETYICQKCKRELRQIEIKKSFSLDDLIQEIPQYKKLKQELKEQIAMFAFKNLSNQAIRDMFVKNIKNIMDSQYITSYNFNIEQGVIKSVTINNVPFLNQIEIEL